MESKSHLLFINFGIENIQRVPIAVQCIQEYRRIEYMWVNVSILVSVLNELECVCGESCKKNMLIHRKRYDEKT